MAHQTLKDPYLFDFLTLHDDAVERDLELGLIDHIHKFLLELGAGFAFESISSSAKMISSSIFCSTKNLPEKSYVPTIKELKRARDRGEAA